MGLYGSYTGVVRWFDPVAHVGHMLVLKDGEVQTDITGDHWASGATGYDEGNGFWLDRTFTAGGTIVAGQPIGLLLSLTYPTDVTIPVVGTTHWFLGDSAGNKITWNGLTLTVVGGISADSGDIGGWDIYPGRLTYDTGVDATSAGMSPSDFPFYSGATYANRASASWRVTPAGAMYIIGPINVRGADHVNVIIGADWETLPQGLHSIYVGTRAGEGANSQYAVAAGFMALSGVTFDYGVGVGYMAGSGATAGPLIAIGPNSGLANAYEKVIAIGSQVVATANQQIVFGSVDVEYIDLYGGGGVAQDATGNASAFTIHATGGVSTNAPGGDMGLAGGLATGNAASGKVIFKTASPVASGSTVQTLTDRAWVNPDGSFDFSQWQQMPEITDPAAPATDYARLYVRDNGSGKTQLCVRFSTGAIQVIATQP